ncbi:MAG: hypothetical protein ABH823_02175 [bacterium]
MFLCLCVGLASAQLLLGGKAGGMGGAGVANVTDMSAVYYNPASFIHDDVKIAKAQVSLGAAYSDPTALQNAISNATDAATFIVDNYGNNLDFNGSLDGVVGLNIKGIGISVLPAATVTVDKNANTLIGSVNTNIQYATTLTAGKSFTVSYLPAALDVGLNLKSISAIKGSIATTGNPTETTGTKYYSTGTGTGIDIGALTSFDVPLVTGFKVGAVIRNLAQTITYSNTSQASTLKYYVTGTTEVVTGAETDLPDTTETAGRAYVIGASAVIPSIGLTVAGDIERASGDINTHLGVEYPIAARAVLLRAGLASGANLSKTSIGAKLNLPFFIFDIVTIADNNNAGLTSYIFDLGFGF